MAEQEKRQRIEKVWKLTGIILTLIIASAEGFVLGQILAGF
jgi:hypothetical protein